MSHQGPAPAADWLGEAEATWAARLGAGLVPAPSAPPRMRPGLKAAAVLVPVRLAVASPELLFIVRPTAMTTHAGQVAFPGGRVDPEDASATDAALRETEEELGIPRTLPRVLGALREVTAPSGYAITPIVALLPPAVSLVPSPAEVDAHFSVPLDRLLDPRERRRMTGRRGGSGSGASAPLHFWVDTPHVIWGVTGHIVDAFLATLARL